MAATTPPQLEQAGELKFGQVGIANLRVKELDIARLGEEMSERVRRAPKMFERAAVVVDFGSLSVCPDAATARSLLDALRSAGVRPVSLAFGTTEIERLSRELDLPLLAKFRAQFETERAEAPAPRETAPAARETPATITQSSASADKGDTPAASASKSVAAAGQIHLQPVRSGQQLYAADRDLTVVNTVGAGAEVIADGSVHIYGALRGRALAGAKGDVSARIFCRDFHAELVAIAGQYRVMEEIPAELRGRAVQAWLEGDKLRIEELG